MDAVGDTARDSFLARSESCSGRGSLEFYISNISGVAITVDVRAVILI